MTITATLTLLLPDKRPRGLDDDFEQQLAHYGFSVIARPNLGFDQWSYRIAAKDSIKWEDFQEGVRRALGARNDSIEVGQALLGAELVRDKLN